MAFDFASVAVLARALFLAMNSSRWRRLARMDSFERSSCWRFSRWNSRKASTLPGKARQLAPGQIERVVTGGAEKRPVVGDDQTRRPMTLQEVFQEDLGAQVEEVRRLVEQQEVRLVQQQCRQLHARLPAPGELRDGPVQVGPLQLELSGDFPAFPVRLTAVAHQKFERGLPGQERDRVGADTPGAGSDGG